MSFGLLIEAIDLGSTNGTSLNSRSNRIERATVTRADSLLLGSTKLSVAALLSDDGATVLESTLAPLAPTLPQSFALKTIVCTPYIFAAALALLLLLLCSLIRPSSHPVVANVRAEIDSTAASAPTIKKAIVTPPKVSDSLPTKPLAEAARPSVSREPIDLRQSAYAVTASDKNGESTVRLATAWAIDEHTLVTTATTVLAMTEVLADSRPTRNVRTADGAVHAIVDTKCHPEYLRIRKQIDERVGTLKEQPESQPPTDSRPTEADRELFMLIEEASHYDLATIRVKESLPSFLPLANEPTSLAGVSLRIVGMPHKQTSSAAESAQLTLKDLSAKIWNYAALDPTRGGNVRAVLEPNGNYLNDKVIEGCVVVDEHQRIVAICNRWSTFSDEQSPNRIDAALSSHLATLISK